MHAARSYHSTRRLTRLRKTVLISEEHPTGSTPQQHLIVNLTTHKPQKQLSFRVTQHSTVTHSKRGTSKTCTLLETVYRAIASLWQKNAMQREQLRLRSQHAGRAQTLMAPTPTPQHSLEEAG